MNTHHIDLEDIQGNIVKGYSRYGYPYARYVFFKFEDPAAGRRFVHHLQKLITNGSPWVTRENLPVATTNIAFTYSGLKNLGLPVESLHGFPQEFASGMKARATILGDDRGSSPEHWDPVWHRDKDVHMFLSINAQTLDARAERYHRIQTLLAESLGRVKQLSGHRSDTADDLEYQDACAIFENNSPSPKEHFGYTDGISDPYFKGCGSNPINVIGGGKPTRHNPKTKAGWKPLETGEFILGYPDETKELPAAPAPKILSMNGTFMVYRKLHQNVGSYNQYIEDVGADFPGGGNLLAAKIAGRWKNGAPLTSFPTEKEANVFADKLESARASMYAAKTDAEKERTRNYFNTLKKQLTAFNYDEDIEGKRCPMGAHMRRANPRGALEYGVTDAYSTPGALSNRRRIIRRGLPYGTVTDKKSDRGDHGIIFMALNASISRQFEFVQQQWINYGNDFKLANEKDPLIGNQDGEGSMQVQGSSAESPPFFCPKLPRFVETRGGEYFFIPSLSAIRMISEGLIDPA